MGQYTTWEIIVICVLVAVVFLAGRVPAFLRRHPRPERLPGSEPGPVEPGEPSA